MRVRLHHLGYCSQVGVGGRLGVGAVSLNYTKLGVVSPRSCRVDGRAAVSFIYCGVGFLQWLNSTGASLLVPQLPVASTCKDASSQDEGGR